jgi:hypothetical protein
MSQHTVPPRDVHCLVYTSATYMWQSCPILLGLSELHWSDACVCTISRQHCAAGVAALATVAWCWGRQLRSVGVYIRCANGLAFSFKSVLLLPACGQWQPRMWLHAVVAFIDARKGQ